jgi:hypothetical protein
MAATKETFHPNPKRDPPRPALRRVHVAAGCPGKQGRTVRQPDSGEPGENHDCGVVRASECREPTARRAHAEPRRKHRDATEAVHRAPGWDGGERPGREHDRRAQAQQPGQIENPGEADRGDGGDEREHRRVRGDRRGEQRHVPPDRERVGARFGSFAWHRV